MSPELKRSQDSKGSISSQSKHYDLLKQNYKEGAQSTVIKSEELTRKHGDAWNDEAYSKMEINLGEMKLLYNMFQKNFGEGKALPSSFKPDETFSKFIENYNHQRNMYVKELPRLNAQVDAYNTNLAEGASKLQKLQLPPQLEVLKPKSSEAKELVKVPEKRSSGSYWDALKSMDSTKVLKLFKTAFVAVLLASCPAADAVKIHGYGCSIESRLRAFGQDPSLAPLAFRLRKQFDKAMPKLVEQFAADPCDTSFENIRLFFTKLPPGEVVQTRRDQTILLDPSQKSILSPEGVFTYQLALLAQNYPRSINENYPWLGRAMAEYARSKFGPAENNDQLPKDHYRDGIHINAGFLHWLEQHKRPDIIDRLHRKMQRGKFTERDFLRWTRQEMSKLWKHYQKKLHEDDNYPYSTTFASNTFNHTSDVVALWVEGAN